MTARPRRRRLRVALAGLAGLYVVWLGITIVRFRPPSPPAAPVSGRPWETTGIYHVHTRFSDGHATPDQIAAVAAGRSLDFVILTDHGNPNRESLRSQGVKSGVLVFAGSELSVSRGHLVALDFLETGPSFPQNADLSARQVAAEGGFAVAAHPYSETPWSWGTEIDFSGIEVVNCDAEAKKNFLRVIPFLPAYIAKPELAMLRTLTRPVQALNKWDSLSAKQPVYGYFAADAHMFYSAVFGCLRLHVLLDEPLAGNFAKARAQVLGALRRGDFYDAADGAASARGFRFWAEAGGAERPMGSEIAWDAARPARLEVRAPFGFAVETRLVRDGRVVETAGGGGLSYLTREAGVYRVEVYLKGWSPLAPDFPWIVSNPIFIRS